MSYTIEQRPSRLPAVADCFYYHTMDVPGHGLRRGQWDLRAGFDRYVGGLDLSGRRVLEIGPASGFLTFRMESSGADVTSCELPSFDQWDLVPYAGVDHAGYVEDRMELGRRLRNGYWLAHAAFESRARLVTCPVYEVPADLGPFDVALFGMVLVHVRDPFLALQSALAETTETVVVTEMLAGSDLSPATQEALREDQDQDTDSPLVGAGLEVALREEVARLPPRLHFCPRYSTGEPRETWWQFNPTTMQEFLGILGFRHQEVTYHYQTYDPGYRWTDPDEDCGPVRHLCFTVVARR